MSINSFSAKFKFHLSKFHTSPFLFVGSGLSRRYLGLPTWYDLLEAFSENLELDYEFGYYASKAENNLPRLASILANEFHEIWWTSESFKESRKLYKGISGMGIQQPFKIELANFVKKCGAINEDFIQEIELFKKSIFDGIITTNWDLFLSDNLSEFETFIGQNQLMFSDHSSLGEIFKIHGCITDPSSIIVTEEDYLSYHVKNQFLAAKLFTIFAEHPIIFLGYSISDENVIEILTSIVNCVDRSDINKLRDRLIFIEWSNASENPEMEDGNIVINHMPLPIKRIRTNDFSYIYNVLGSLKQRLPIKILKKCKNAVYDLIKTNKSSNTILVGDIDQIHHHEDIEFVIGVGVASQYSENGYIGISNINIIEDIVFDNKGWDSAIVIKDVIPKLFKGKIYLPLYKYLRQNGDLDDKGKLFNFDKYNDKIVEAIGNNDVKIYYPKGATYLRKRDEINRNILSIEQLFEKYEFKHVLLYIPFIQHRNIDLECLKDFLSQHFSVENSKNTDYKKIVCYYDYLKYGLQLDYYVNIPLIEQ